MTAIDNLSAQARNGDGTEVGALHSPMTSTRSSGRCRSCGAPLRHTFVNLGMSPLCESYVPEDKLNAMEPFYPLHAFVCDQCWLVQLLQYVSPHEIFTEYAYLSSYSDTWLQHARRYVETISNRLNLKPEDQVVEVACNDGYLLQYFVQRGQRVLGIEPAKNVAAVAGQKGIPVVTEFFGAALARRLVSEGLRACLLLGNNVYAHVPDLNDFTAGLKILLAPGGVITLEFPHLQRLIEGNQFDTIYHEHFSYLSLIAVDRVLERHGLRLFDVEELPTHGGSLRVYATHLENADQPATERVAMLHARERSLGFEHLETYRAFDRQVQQTKWRLVEFLIKARRDGKRIAGYGAPGKGNTLLNYCGIRTDLLDYVVDRNPYKQGKFLPGTHIPIHPPERLAETRPDYILMLPWNLRNEIAGQLQYVRSWGGRLVVPIPTLEILP